MIMSGAQDASTGGDVHTRSPKDLAIPSRYLIPLTINYKRIALLQVKSKLFGDRTTRIKITGEMTKISFPRDPTCTLFQASRELMGSKSLHLSGFATSHSPTDTGYIKGQAPFQNRRHPRFGMNVITYVYSMCYETVLFS